MGCAPGLLTEEARRAVEEAAEVYGSRRGLDIAGVEGCEVEDWGALDEMPEDAVLLSTGDPAFSGLGRYGESLPGVSCYQLGCNRLGLAMEETVPVTSHGRDGDTRFRVERVLDAGLNVFLLPGGVTALDLAGLAEERGYGCVALERLGYPDEAIVSPREEHRSPFSVAAGPDVEKV